MDALFISVRVLDVIDILLVAFIMYQIYYLIKGTVAMNIFIAIFLIYLIWLIVKALNMQLLGTILGQFIGVGIIALIIVFQQEIRRFLLMLGTRYMSKKFSLENLFSWNVNEPHRLNIRGLVTACTNLSDSKTGALIVIARESALHMYAETGEIINAYCSARLIESIFFKNSPLHDGAILIINDRIYAAKCILPVSQNILLPKNYGLRHRAALGMSEYNDSVVVVISEETGKVGVAIEGRLQEDLDQKELSQLLESIFMNVTDKKAD